MWLLMRQAFDNNLPNVSRMTVAVNHELRRLPITYPADNTTLLV
jgi:hypothetical protein